MKYTNTSKYRLPFVAGIVLMLSGCGGIEVYRMVPESESQLVQRFNYSLKVVEPIGGRKSQFGVQDFVENEEFHAALMSTLTDSKLFASIRDTGTSDRELHSEIIAVSPSGGFNMTFAFVVQYWITDPTTGDEVWRKGINARHEVRVSETWSGAARSVQALEGAVRKNLERLVEELSIANL